MAKDRYPLKAETQRKAFFGQYNNSLAKAIAHYETCAEEFSISKTKALDIGQTATHQLHDIFSKWSRL